MSLCHLIRHHYLLKSRNTGWTKLNNKCKTHTGFSHKVFWLFLEMLYFGYIGISKRYNYNSYHPFIFFPFIHVPNRKSKIKYVAFLCSSLFFFSGRCCAMCLSHALKMFISCSKGIYLLFNRHAHTHTHTEASSELVCQEKIIHCLFFRLKCQVPNPWCI